MKKDLKKDLRIIYTGLMVWMPILNIYGCRRLPSLGIGELLGILLIPLLLFKINLKMDNLWYWMFVGYVTVISLIWTLVIPEYSVSETAIKVVKMIFYTMLIFTFPDDHLDLRLAQKWYTDISVIAAVYLFVQSAMQKLTGNILPNVIPHMILTTSGFSSEEFTAAMIRNATLWGTYRPQSFFLEPAGFCQYTSYAVLLLLFKGKKEKRDHISLLLIMAAILLSYSAIGYMALMCALGIWFLCTWKKRGFWFNGSLVAGSLILLMAVNARFGFALRALERIRTIESTTATTGTLRILRGIIVYDKIPFLYKVMGIGAGNYAAFIERYDIVTFFDTVVERTVEYMNAFSTILVSAGVIGLLLYVRALYGVMKKADLCQKCIFAVLCVVMSSSNIFFSATYMLPMILISQKEEACMGPSFFKSRPGSLIKMRMVRKEPYG